MALTSGTKLGPYEIQSPLGAGGMGEVYRARDTRLERDVAIKVLPANLSSDPNLRQRLEREAKAISKLSHPHICTLHDIGHQDGVDFLVMELVEGETLEQRLMKGSLPPDQTLRYAAQIADALAKAHKLGIVHRDLKPSNVMLTKTGAKLMDFGLAKDSGPAPLATALTEMTRSSLCAVTSTLRAASVTSLVYALTSRSMSFHAKEPASATLPEPLLRLSASAPDTATKNASLFAVMATSVPAVMTT